MNTTAWLRHPAILEQDLGEELLLYQANGKQVHVLNATGRAVWRLCDGQHGMDQIVEQIRASFAGSDERDVAQDVAQLIAALSERHLLTE